MTQLTTPENQKQDFLSRTVLTAYTIDWEKAIYIIFIVLAIVTRFWDLGSRVMSHDESLHTQFSYQFYDGQGFNHTPLMHGPLLFHITAVSYWLFGDTDLTARIPIAILGVILVVIPYFLRRWLGREGALVTSFIFLISPFVTYYARYIRHDTPVIVWAMIIFIAIMYYMRERKDKYLWWLGAGMALLFATKEVSFIYIAIFGSFMIMRLLAKMAISDWIKSAWPSLQMPLLVLGVAVLLIGGGAIGHLVIDRQETAVTIEATTEAEPFAADPNADETAVETEETTPLDMTMRWLIIAGIATLSGALFLAARAMRSYLDNYPEFDIIVLFTSIVLPMASPVLVSILGWDPRDYSMNTCMVEGQEAMSAFQLLVGRAGNAICREAFLSSGMVRSGSFLLITLLVGVLIGIWWNWQRWSVFAVIFHTIFFVLYTSVFTNLPGWTSGMIGSLGYWLEQQGVARGNQPEFYYFIVVPFYEFLSLIFALAAIRLWTQKQRINRVLGYWFSVLVLALLGYSLSNWFFNRLSDPIATEPNTFGGNLAGGFIIIAGILIWIFWVRNRLLDTQNKTALADYLVQYLDGNSLTALCELLSLDEEELVGNTTQQKLADLVVWYEENGRLSKLTTTLRSNWYKLVTISSLGDDAPGKFTYSQQRNLVSHLQVSDLFGFIPFLVWWLILTWAAYSWAGEKMPWLSTHFVIPMGMLSGWYIHEKIQQTGGIKEIIKRPALSLLGTTILFILVAAIGIGPLFVGQVQFGDQGLQNLGNIGRFLGGLISAGVIFYFWQQLSLRVNLPTRRTVFALAIFAVLSMLTIRFMYMSSFPNADYATEYMVYAHGAPAAKTVVLEQVEELSMRLNGDKTMQVAFGGSGVAWPFTWYLRDYPNRNYFAESPDNNLTDYPVVIVGRTQMENVDRILSRTHDYTTHTYLWWPMEEYRNISWNAIFGDPNMPEETRRGLGNPLVRQSIWNIFFYRDYEQYSQVFGGSLTTGEWPLRDDLRLYIRKDMLATLWDYGVSPVSVNTLVDPYAEGELFLTPSQIINESGIASAEEGVLSAPRNLAVAENGRIFVADSGNHRVQVFEADGTFVTSWGLFGSDPGQFNEPWGIAVDNNFVYVADTWNHRIQKFTHAGQLAGVFGGSGAAADDPETNGLGLFFGPRDIILYGDNQLLVTDTGNHRIQVLDRDGTFVTQVGSQGNLQGQFFEPVGLAEGLSGEIFLADTWNGRIQQFTRDLFAYKEWQVDAWGGNSINNKPYMAADRDGRIYLTDPEGFRIIIFNSMGEYLGRFGSSGTGIDQLGLPNGIFIDGEDNIYIADAGNNRILKFDPIFPAPPETAVEEPSVEDAQDQEIDESAADDEAIEDENSESNESEENVEDPIDESADEDEDEEAATDEEAESDTEPTPTPTAQDEASSTEDEDEVEPTPTASDT
ncbi:MAG: TIGR03663 family protein [Chloroflexi bacterium]|nr:TIGR03663 family protein [Chloroflexota bacterium]